MLKGMGASLVLRDNARLDEFLRATAGETPRLGLDALGGEHGKRMAMALRPEASLVVYALEQGKLPALSSSLLLYQQISLHGFSLAQWVTDEGAAAYLGMLEAIAALVKLGKVGVVTRAVRAAELGTEGGTSLRMSRRLLREEGLMCGGSSGAAMHACLPRAHTVPALPLHSAHSSRCGASR